MKTIISQPKTYGILFDLRNRKHVPGYYRVIETRVGVWENEKCCGNKKPQTSVSTAFSSSPNMENMFSFYFRKHRDEKRKTICLLRSSKCKFSLLAPSLRQQLVLVLCFYRVIGTRLLTNQRA